MKFFKLLLFTFLFFLFIFGPVLNSIGPWADLIFVTSLGLCGYSILLFGIRLPRYFVTFLPIIIVFVYIVVLITEFEPTGFSDYFRFALKPFRILCTLYGGFVLVELVKRNYPDSFIQVSQRFVFFSIVIHASIMCFQLYSVDFKDWIYSFTTTGVFRGSYGYNFRMGGLSGNSGGAVLSVVQSLGIIIMPFILTRIKSTGKILVFLGGLVIFASVLFCGRSGLFNILIFTPVSVYLASNIRGFQFGLRIFIILGISMVVFSILFYVMDTVESDSALFYSLNRTLDTIIKFRESGSYENETVNTLTGHILFPTDLKVLIFGDGETHINTQFDRVLRSDIGYIRNFWGMGIVVFTIYILPILRVWFDSLLYRKRSKIASLLFIVTTIMLIFHAKEGFLYVRMFFSIFSILIFCFYFQRIIQKNDC